MKLKKFTAALSALAVSATMLTALPAAVSTNAAADYNYGEALQKSMFFYEVQQCGELPDWNFVQWRGDSMVNDVAPGGWFDAGDHLKFALTNAYSATLLAWGLIEYGDAVEKAGLTELYKNNLKWGLDYLVECDLGNKIIYMIGEGAFDHVWWGSAEVYMNKYTLKGGSDPRPAYTCQDSSIEAQMACALAAGYMIYKDENYLKHAEDLFKRADAEKILGEDAEEHAYYKPSSFYDDLFFAANWLYKATGQQSYLDKATSYVPNLDKEQQSEEMKFTWGHCWDDTTQGAMLLYAQNTGDEQWATQVKKHLEYWTTGYGGKEIQKTPDGLSWLFQWGSLRHATTTAWIAALACDTIFKDDAALCAKYNEFAKFTMDYCFGSNAAKMSYVLGFGENNPKAFHHRTASGIHDDHWNELGQSSTPGGEEWQTEYAHTLYGALVGGPNNDGSYKDVVDSYQNTEVAIDYNAGFTACLCAMIDDYGGSMIADFPPKETPKWDEWQMAAVLNGSGASYSELKVWAMNHTAWPTRVQKDVKFRYFFDASEVFAAGLTVDDISFETKAQQYSEGEPGYGKANGIHQYSGDIYYAEIVFEDGRAIMPTGQSEHRDEVQFRISIPDAIDGKPTTGAWDASNDWSYEGVEKATSLKTKDSLNPHITMYVNDALVWGEEPDGTKAVPGADLGETDTPKPPTTTKVPTTTAPVVTTTTVVTTQGGAVGNDDDLIWGDFNDDEKVTVADAAAILQHLANGDRYPGSEKGRKQGDVDGEKGITAKDASVILKYTAGVITKLPVA